MEAKKKGPAVKVQPDEEVLNAARELPQTMKGRFYLKLKPETVIDCLIHCLNATGCERGEELSYTVDYHILIASLSEAMCCARSNCGYLFSGQFRTGKTTLLLAIRKFFELLKNHPSAWEYQEIDSLDSMLLRADEFRYPTASYEVFKEAATVPVLFIDNLGHELGGTQDRLAVELIKSLISTRFDKRLVTIISTPFDGVTIRETYGCEIATTITYNYFTFEIECRPFKRTSMV